VKDKLTELPSPLYVVEKKNAEHYLWGGVCDGWHLAKSSNLSVIQERVPPGAKEEMHCHHFAEQFFYVLSGQATLWVQGNEYRLDAGQGMHVAANLFHQMLNESDQDVHFLVISTPPSHGDREVASDEPAFT